LGFSVPARNTAIGVNPISISGLSDAWRDRRADSNAIAISAAHSSALAARYAR
jgi:hypothetical protein